MKKILSSIVSLCLSLSIVSIPMSAYAGNTNILHCTAAGSLQDKVCTPGAVFPNATKKVICVSGYTAKVRSVTASTKRKVFAEYGVTVHSGSTYEVDHLIPLELGGSNDIANLWAEPANPKPGFHEKDKVENYLHKQVCSGAMSLKDAQQIMATDWQKGQVSAITSTPVSPKTPVTPIPVQTPTSAQTYVPAPTPVYVPPATTYTPPTTTQSQSPIQSSSVPAGATAICKDGSYSFSTSHSGTCSHHGGVVNWL